MKQSKKWTLNKTDLQKWGRNTLIFSAPLLIIFLTELQKGRTIGEALPLVYAALINVVLDFLKKLYTGK